MNWSTAPPTEPGWYQYRPPDAGLIVFYKIVQAPNGELVGMVEESLEHLGLATMPGQWRGPILDIEAWR